MKKMYLLLILLFLTNIALNAIENKDAFAQQLSNKYPAYSMDKINNFLGRGANKYLNTNQLEKLFFKKTVYDKTLKQLNKISQPKLKAKLNFYLGNLSTEVFNGDYKKISSYFKKVIDLDPDFENLDIALYNYAYYNFQAERESVIDRKLKYLETSTQQIYNYPIEMRLTKNKVQHSIDAYMLIPEDSELYGEALYRLGMLYFELLVDAEKRESKIEYINKASDFFSTLSNSENEDFKVLSEFQKGWTSFSKEQYEDAINEFTTVLISVQDDAVLASQIKADAVRVLTFSLIEQYDGFEYIEKSEAANQLNTLFAGKLSKETIKEIVVEAIRLKLYYQAPSQVIDFYNEFITMFPNDHFIPTYVDSIISMTKKYAFYLRENKAYSINQKNLIDKNVTKLVLSEYERLVNFYNTDSQWYKDNQNTQISDQLDVIFTAYESLYPRYRKPIFSTINQGVLDKEDLLRFEELTINFQKFPSFQEKSEIIDVKDIYLMLALGSLNIAQNNMNFPNFEDALKRIGTFITKYPVDDYVETLMDNQYFVVTDFYKKTKEEQNPQSPEEILANPVDSLYITYSKKYENYLKNKYPELGKLEDTVISIIWDRADLYYQSLRLDLAYADYETLLDLNIDNSLRADIYQLLASMNYNKNNFELANLYFKKQMELVDAQTKKTIKENIKNTTINLAQQQLDNNDFMAAADSYLSLGTTEAKGAAADVYFKNKEYMLAAKYFLELNTDNTLKFAAISFKKAGEFQKSIDLWIKISIREKKYEEKLKYYQTAWTITDSLKDYHQSIRLREKFIRLDAFANAANIQKYRIIQYYYDNKLPEFAEAASKEKAAEEYLALFEQLERKNIKQIDFDQQQLPISTLYFSAFTIYENLGQEERSIALMKDFEAKHPNNNEVKLYMRRILTVKYKKSNQQDKYEELVEKIFKKTPADTLVTLNSEGQSLKLRAEDEFRNIAKSKLKTINDSIAVVFAKRDLRETRKEIASFKHVHRVYTQKGLVLNFDFLFNSYKFYVDYLQYLPTYERKIASVDKVIRDDKFYKNFRIVGSTKIKQNILSREIPQLKKAIKKVVDANLEIIKKRNTIYAKANEFGVDAHELDYSDINYIYYTNAKIYEYGSEVIGRGLQKWFAVSNEYRKWKRALETNPTKLQQITAQVKNGIKKQQTKLTTFNKKNPLESSFGFYYMIYNSSYKNGYYDKWGFESLNIFRKLNMPPFRDYILKTDSSNQDWFNNAVALSDSTSDFDHSSSWVNMYESNVETDSNFVKGNYELLLTEYDMYVKPNKPIIGPNEIAMIEYISQDPVEIYVNNELIETVNKVVDSIMINNEKYNLYNEFVSKEILKQMKNDIYFKLPVKENSVATQKYFKAKISSYLDYTARKNLIGIENLVSNSEWDVTSIVTENVVTNIDTNWVKAEAIADSMIENKVIDKFTYAPEIISIPSSYSAISDTITFSKTFDLPVELDNAKLSVVGNDISIYINGMFIHETDNTTFDYNAEVINPNLVKLPKLDAGSNNIVIKSKGHNDHKVLLEIIFDSMEDLR